MWGMKMLVTAFPITSGIWKCISMVFQKGISDQSKQKNGTMCQKNCRSSQGPRVGFWQLESEEKSHVLIMGSLQTKGDTQKHLGKLRGCFSPGNISS